MNRSILPSIINDLEEKIVIISGPRQVGKTTLVQGIDLDKTYLNYDIVEDRRIIVERSWPKDSSLLIFDELHKMPNWKQYLKGIYDAQKSKKKLFQKIIVTGSARLDLAKKMGDSLAGRHFNYILNPYTVRELRQVSDPLKSLLEFSGFPEPLFKANKRFYRRWQTTHLDLILRQDLLDLEQIRNISQIELLTELLRSRVGTPCSYTSLSEDLQVSPATVKNWLRILENLYIIFKITPFHRNVARSILKTPKFYFYDIGRVPDTGGARFENLVALSLKSAVDFALNVEGQKYELNYLRNKDSKEIDFLVTHQKSPVLAVEAKMSDTQPDPSFKTYFGEGKLSCPEIVQLVSQNVERKEYPFGLKIEPAEKWLKNLQLR